MKNSLYSYPGRKSSIISIKPGESEDWDPEWVANEALARCILGRINEGKAEEDKRKTINNFGSYFKKEDQKPDYNMLLLNLKQGLEMWYTKNLEIKVTLDNEDNVADALSKLLDQELSGILKKSEEKKESKKEEKIIISPPPVCFGFFKRKMIISDYEPEILKEKVMEIINNIVGKREKVNNKKRNEENKNDGKKKNSEKHVVIDEIRQSLVSPEENNKPNPNFVVNRIEVKGKRILDNPSSLEGAIR